MEFHQRSWSSRKSQLKLTPAVLMSKVVAADGAQVRRRDAQNLRLRQDLGRIDGRDRNDDAALGLAEEQRIQPCRCRCRSRRG